MFATFAARLHELALVAVEVDAGISGSTMDRPASSSSNDLGEHHWSVGQDPSEIRVAIGNPAGLVGDASI